MSNIASKKGKGWMRDLPDYRDNTPFTSTLTKKQKERGATKSVNAILAKLDLNGKSTKGKKSTLSTKIDLREWCSPIEDQGELGACTAHAGVGLYEYYERRAFGKH